jgi:hypothetical protein
VLLYALAPKPGGAQLVLSLIAVGLTATGLRALVSLRTWGVLALGGAGAIMLSLAGVDLIGGYDAAALTPALGGSLLVFAAWPFAAPLARALRS